MIRAVLLVFVAAGCSHPKPACPTGSLQGAEFCVTLPAGFQERSDKQLDGWDTREYNAGDASGKLLMRVNPNASYDAEIKNSTTGSATERHDITGGIAWQTQYCDGECLHIAASIIKVAHGVVRCSLSTKNANDPGLTSCATLRPL